MPDHFEHLTPDEAWEARERLARADFRRQRDLLPDGRDRNENGCGCMSVAVLLALIGLIVWLLDALFQ